MDLAVVKGCGNVDKLYIYENYVLMYCITAKSIEFHHIIN